MQFTCAVFDIGVGAVFLFTLSDFKLTGVLILETGDALAVGHALLGRGGVARPADQELGRLGNWVH